MISNLDFLKRVLYEYQHGVQRSKWLWEQGFDRSKSMIENKGRIVDYDVSMKELLRSNDVQVEKAELKLSMAAEEGIKASLVAYGDYPEPSDQRRKSEIQYGVYASGSSVRADTIDRKYIPWGSENKTAEEKISACFEEARKQYRDIIAVEMEGAAFYQVLHDTGIKAICVKGVSDYGDHQKDDQIHRYGKEIAASFAWELIRAYYEIYKKDLNVESRKKKKLDHLKNEGTRSTNLTGVVSHFKGRRLEELKIRIQELQKANSGSIMCAITGIAGSGKSELAKAYASMTFPGKASIFTWRLDPDATSDRQISYQSSYLELLNYFDCKAHDSTSNLTLLAVWNKIYEYSQWIVIFDNAISYRDIHPYMPPNLSIKGLVLVTTQNIDFFLQKQGHHFSINDGLEHKEATNLLLDIWDPKEEQEHAFKLVEQLDYLPLGIRVAGAYLQITGGSCEEYIKSLEDNSQFMDVDFPDQQMENLLSRSVQDQKRIWTLQRTIHNLVVKLKERQPLFVRLLEWCAYLNNQDIPKSLLLELYRQQIQEGEKLEIASEKIEARFNIMMKGTENYSLIISQDGGRPENQSYNLHRTTQVVIREMTILPIPIIKRNVDVMIRLYGYSKYSMERTRLCQEMEKHYLTVYQQIRSIRANKTAEDLKIEEEKLQAILREIIWSQKWIRNPKMEVIKDKEFMMETVKKEGRTLEYASEELQNDKDVVGVAVRQWGPVLQFASGALRNDPEIVLMAVQKDAGGDVLSYASEAPKNNKDVVLAAVKIRGQVLRFASEVLRNDTDIVLAAVKQQGLALRYASEEMKNNKQIVLVAVQKDWRALKHASDEIKDHKDIVLAEVQRHGYALIYASKALRNDQDVVYAAVQQNRDVLQFANPGLYNNPEFVTRLKTIPKFISLELIYAAWKVCTDRAKVLQGVERECQILEYVREEFQRDPEIVYVAVKRSGRALQYASEELQNERQLVHAAVVQEGRALQYASPKLRNDEHIVYTAVKQNGDALQYGSSELKNHKLIVYAAVKQSGGALKYASETLRNDTEIVLAAVIQDGSVLADASAAFQNNREIVLAAVQQDGQTLVYASPEMKNDKELVLAAVQNFGLALQDASPELQNNKEIVLTAVKRHGTALEYANPELQNDKEIVYTAVIQDGDALEYASPSLQEDKDVVLAAVRKSGRVLQYASEETKRDKEIVLAAVQQEGWAVEYANPELWNDQEIVMAAIKQNGSDYALRHGSSQIKNDPEFILSVVRQCGGLLEYASSELQSDREIVLAAVQQQGEALQYASSELKSDREVVLAAVQQQGQALEYASEELQNDKEMVFTAVKRDGWALLFASETLQNQEEMVLAAVQNGYPLKYASPELRHNKEVVLAAVKHNRQALQYASPALQKDPEVLKRLNIKNYRDTSRLVLRTRRRLLKCRDVASR